MTDILAQVKELLRDIVSPPCGCSPPCRCYSDQASLELFKEGAQAAAGEALELLAKYEPTSPAAPAPDYDIFERGRALV